MINHKVKSAFDFKVLFAVVVIGGYLIMMTFYHFVYQNRYRTSAQLPCTGLTVLLQPIMELAFYSKITHGCHWQETDIEVESLESQLYLKSDTQTRNLTDNSINGLFTNIMVELDPNQESVVLQPVDSDEPWRLFFYDIEARATRKSSIIHRGPVKILLDGEFYFYGVDLDNEVVELELVDRGEINDFRDQLYI